jgi:hypothetical protein
MRSNKVTVSRGILAAAVMMLAVSAGCRTINKGLTESVLERKPSREWRVHYGSRIHYTLTDETLRDVEFEGARDANDVVVRYQRGLAEQAQCIAATTAGLLSEVEKRTGVTLSTRSTIYLLRLDHRPQYFDIMLSAEPNEFLLPLFVQAGDESCASILAQNRSYPYLLTHELIETSLASGVRGGRVLPDLAWRLFGLRLQVNNYTRWFREGLANYGGYVAYETLSKQTSAGPRPCFREALVHTNPFSSLDQVGDRLFSWPQSSNPESERVYYNAALGLFLLIADTFGEPAIRDITREVAGRKIVDGHDLLEITNQVLKTDVRKLAEDFEFPRVDLELEPLSPALALNRGVELREGLFVVEVPKDSAAARAGLKQKDVITAVGSTPVVNYLDFELGLFQARRQPTVPLTVQRVGVGTLTIELPLEKTATHRKGIPPGERQDPLKKDRIEFVHLSLFPGL